MLKKLVRFDWAIKKILRHKANFAILEGFLSELLGQEVTIKQVLESESNKETATDKFNRVDILVENEKGELIIIEVQNTQEHDYFHRMLFGAAKVITEHIREGQQYSHVKKVISITIAYFDLGQGKDYVYHGTNVFKGIHKGDIMGLSDKQIETYNKTNVYEIYPEYWVIKTDKFNDKVKDKLDEWIYFFKNSEIKKNFSAKGLKEANEVLDSIKLSEKDRQSYNYYLKNLRDIASQNHTLEVDAKHLIAKAKKEGQEQGREEGLEQGIKQGQKEMQINSILGFFENGIPASIIAKSLNIADDEVNEVIANHRKKSR